MTRLYEIAHGRAGDKGDTSNISVIAFDAAFAHIARGPIRRYELPRLRALNFVIEGALGGGVTRSLAQDAHGKSLSSLMMSIELGPIDPGDPCGRIRCLPRQLGARRSRGGAPGGAARA
jgi:hypothetical protein